MKSWHWLVIVLVLLVGSYTGGFFHGKSTCPKNPEVIDETDTETEHVQPPKMAKKTTSSSKSDVPNIMNRDGMCAWFEKCYRSDYEITGKFNPKKSGWFDVNVYDACKKGHKSFKIGVPSKFEWDQIGIGPSVLIVQDIPGKKTKGLIGATFQYTHWWGNLGLSPSVGGYGSIDKEFFAGRADILLNYKW